MTKLLFISMFFLISCGGSQIKHVVPDSTLTWAKEKGIIKRYTIDSLSAATPIRLIDSMGNGRPWGSGDSSEYILEQGVKGISAKEAERIWYDPKRKIGIQGDPGRDTTEGSNFRRLFSDSTPSANDGPMFAYYDFTYDTVVTDTAAIIKLNTLGTGDGGGVPVMRLLQGHQPVILANDSNDIITPNHEMDDVRDYRNHNHLSEGAVLYDDLPRDYRNHKSALFVYGDAKIMTGIKFSGKHIDSLRNISSLYWDKAPHPSLWLTPDSNMIQTIRFGDTLICYKKPTDSAWNFPHPITERQISRLLDLLTSTSIRHK